MTAKQGVCQLSSMEVVLWWLGDILEMVMVFSYMAVLPNQGVQCCLREKNRHFNKLLIKMKNNLSKGKINCPSICDEILYNSTTTILLTSIKCGVYCCFMAVLELHRGLSWASGGVKQCFHPRDSSWVHANKKVGYTLVEW